MSRHCCRRSSGNILTLFIIAAIITAAKWAWEHRIEIGLTVFAVCVITLILIALHRIGDHVQRREAEHDAIGRRADLQEQQIAEGNRAGVYGFIHPNELSEFDRR